MEMQILILFKTMISKYLRHTIHPTQIDDGDQWDPKIASIMN